MRTAPLLVLFLALAADAALGQGKTSMQRYTGARVSTVRTDQPVGAGRAIGGLSVDHQGRLYSATFRSTIYRFERDGSVTTLSTSFRQASGNTIDSGGELVQSEYELDRLYRVHEDGSRTLITDTGLDGPVGVVQADSGDFFVVNFRGDTITRVTPAGVSSQFSADPLINGPNGIIIDDAGDMYVVNFGDNRLLRIDANGNASLVAAIGSGANAHVAALDGKLYVSKIWAHGIYEVTPGGAVRLLVGDGVRGARDGFAPHQARLFHPNGITAGRKGKVLYTNNYLGTMGNPAATLRIRVVHLND